MYIINESILKFAWASDDLINKMNLETSFTANMVSDDDFSDKTIFTQDERPFFEQKIGEITIELADLFSRFMSIMPNTIQVDKTADELWNISSKISGFDIKIDADTSLNNTQLDIIDDKVLHFIICSLKSQWFQTVGDLTRLKQIDEEKEEFYITLCSKLRYIKALNAYTPHKITIKE